MARPVDTPELARKREREAQMVSQMIALWCRGHHGGGHAVEQAGDDESVRVKLGLRTITLCPECAELQKYAIARIEHCPHMGTKTFCSACPSHCYRPAMREKIREVIGSGGKVIQKICADTGCKIDIEDDGSIFIASEDIEACRAARKTIENIVFEPEVGELYYGKVSNIRSDFGAWVELAPGKDGLVKIKDLEFKRTEKVEDVLKIGDMTWVKVMNVDDRGRIDLSRKDAMREKGLM